MTSTKRFTFKLGNQKVHSATLNRNNKPNIKNDAFLWSIGDRYHDWWPSNRGDINSFKKCGDWEFLPDMIHYGIICDSILAYEKNRHDLGIRCQFNNDDFKDVLPSTLHEWNSSYHLSKLANKTLGLIKKKGISKIEGDIVKHYVHTKPKNKSIPKKFLKMEGSYDNEKAIQLYKSICESIYGEYSDTNKWFAVVCDADPGPLCKLFQNIINYSIKNEDTEDDKEEIEKYCAESEMFVMYMIQTPQTYADSANNMSFIPSLTLYRFPVTDPVTQVVPATQTPQDYPEETPTNPNEYNGTFICKFNYFTKGDYTIEFSKDENFSYLNKKDPLRFTYTLKGDGKEYKIQYGMIDGIKYRYKGPSLYELMLHYLHLNLLGLSCDDNIPVGENKSDKVIYNYDINPGINGNITSFKKLYTTVDDLEREATEGGGSKGQGSEGQGVTAATVTAAPVTAAPVTAALDPRKSSTRIKAATEAKAKAEAVAEAAAAVAQAAKEAAKAAKKEKAKKAAKKAEGKPIALYSKLCSIRKSIDSALGLIGIKDDIKDDTMDVTNVPATNATLKGYGSKSDMTYREIDHNSLCNMPDYDKLPAKIMIDIKHEGDASQVIAAEILNNTSEFKGKIIFISKDRPCFAHSVNRGLCTINYSSTEIDIYNKPARSNTSRKRSRSTRSVSRSVSRSKSRSVSLSASRSHKRRKTGNSTRKAGQSGGTLNCIDGYFDIQDIILTVGMHASRYLSQVDENTDPLLHMYVMNDLYNDVCDKYSENNVSLEDAITDIDDKYGEDIDDKYGEDLTKFMKIIQTIHNKEPIDYLESLTTLGKIHNEYYGIKPDVAGPVEESEAEHVEEVRQVEEAGQDVNVDMAGEAGPAGPESNAEQVEEAGPAGNAEMAGPESEAAQVDEAAQVKEARPAGNTKMDGQYAINFKQKPTQNRNFIKTRKNRSKSRFNPLGKNKNSVTIKSRRPSMTPRTLFGQPVNSK